MATEITTTDIATAALDPLKVKVDGQEVEARSIDELLKADQYLDAQTAASKAHRGIRFTKLIPGGTD